MIEINTLTQGDAYELIKQLPDKSVDLIYTDIPYEFVTGGYSKTAMGQRIQKNDDEIIFKNTRLQYLQEKCDYYRSIMEQYPSDSDEYQKAHIILGKYMQDIDCIDISSGIDYSIFDEFVRVMKEIYIYIWCSKLQIPYILNYFVEKDCNFEILVWCKTNPVPKTNNNFLPDIEYCLFFRQKNMSRKLNNGYELKSKYFITPINQYDKEKYSHPTIKPYELVKRHILHATNQNDLILDPFTGSGTTLKVCKDTGRNFIGFEIDKKYCQIALDRLDNIDITGQTSLF